MPDQNSDTIAAIATPPGRGGVGIIRISGPLAKNENDQSREYLDKLTLKTTKPLILV